MAKEFKMPELNSVVIVGNLTKDPVFRQTMRGTPVVNFTIASNRRFRDSKRQWKEDVCFVGVVAWNKLAESCRGRLKKSSAVLVEGELQSRNLKISLTSILNCSTTSFTATPLLFIYVNGLTSKISLPLYFPEPITYSPFPCLKSILRFFAIASTTINPTLCLVISYSLPGFPSPNIAIIFI